uniref:Uncharacterized protein n=1 Tax=Bracon brevicornis TaxID=1563983 RepID=A0A6V7K0C2_9HYME
MSDLVKMWCEVSRNNADESELNFRAQHIERFYEVINKQVLHTAGIQLGLCTLRKISTPTFTIMENKMKSSSPEVMSKVLLFFNEKSLEVLHLLNFDTTASTTHSLNP